LKILETGRKLDLKSIDSIPDMIKNIYVDTMPTDDLLMTMALSV